MAARRAALLVVLSAIAAGCAAPAAERPLATDADPAALLRDAQAFIHVAGETLPARIAEDVVAMSYLVGHDAGEPTIGIAADGTMYYAAATFDNLCTPDPAPSCIPRTDILRSTDQGKTWQDVTPYLPGGLVRSHADTGDPMVYVDPATGRVFDIDQRLRVTCYTVSYSDTLGDSWNGPYPACDTPPADHQTIVAAKPRQPIPMPLYPNLVYVCYNQILVTNCLRSIDGGTTFQKIAPPFRGFEIGKECIIGPVASALVGHLKAASDGTVYLPREHCGVAVVAKTADDGLTWQVTQVSDEPAYSADPALAVDDDGNVYVVWQAKDDSHIHLATSTDQGATWSTPVDVTPPGMTAAHLPALVAGSAGRIALAFVATDDPEGFEEDLTPDEANATWHGYVSVITDALGASPTITTARVNPIDDPLVRGRCGPGRCPGLIDFIDIQIDAAGRPWAAFVDACIEDCATGEDPRPNASDGFVSTIARGPGLRGALPPLA